MFFGKRSDEEVICDAASLAVELPDLFLSSGAELVSVRGASRKAGKWLCGDIIRDRCGDAECAFLRTGAGPTELELHLTGHHALAVCPAGGWVLEPDNPTAPAYWIPAIPMGRSVDAQGHILAEAPAAVAGAEISASRASFALRWSLDQQLDLTVWQLKGQSRGLVAELSDMHPCELQPIFLWGSHTSYGRPADVYLHLVHGWVYENRRSWPKYWKICSENDAHALYVALSGLQRSTGKSIYHILKQQLLVSVLARQQPDGGWRHGEWTAEMESHFRLCASAAHMFMDALAEADDQTVRDALSRAAAFLAKARDETANGVWFLHDELEQSSEGMAKGPFRWLPSPFLGKSPSNMLVLNTHLDTCIALDRYQTVTADSTHASLVSSAQRLTTKILSLRTAEWLYRPLFWAISLTQLPTERARRLPLPMRALKRVARELLVPNLYRVKTLFPRLVMPGGYVDRSLSLRSGAFHYLSINAMDLLRYFRRFRDPLALEVAHAAVAFARDSTIRERWRELTSEKYALGFWAETLYHLCLLEDDHSHRALLAQAATDLDQEERGVPPSLLGANCEAVPREHQHPTPLSGASRLRVLNLCGGGREEWLFVNTGRIPAPLPGMDTRELRWVDSSGSSLSVPPAMLAPGSWCRAVGSRWTAVASPVTSTQSTTS